MKKNLKKQVSLKSAQSFNLKVACCDHSDGPDNGTIITYIGLVKGLFSPDPLTVGILSPLIYHNHCYTIIHCKYNYECHPL